MTRRGSRRCSPSTTVAKFTGAVPTYQGLQVFEANRPIINDLKAAPGSAGRQPARPHAPGVLRPLLPALLALPQPADLQGRVELVRRGDQLPRPDGRAQRADHLGARARQARPVRQVARPTPATGRSAGTASGAARSRSGSPTTRTTPGRRLRLVRRARGRLRRRGHRPAPAVHRRADPAQPRRPDRPLDDAPGRPTSSTSGSTPARCRSRRCTTRSRTPTGSSTTSRATSSSSTSARPAAGSTRCTSWPRPCSTGRRSRPASATASCSAATGQKMSKSLRNYPDVSRGLRPRRRRRHALVPHVLADPARRQPGRHRAGHPRRRAPGAAAAVELVVLLLALRQRRSAVGRATRRSGRPGRTDVAGPLPAGQAAPSWSSASRRQLDAYDVAGACDSVRGFLDVLTNWYIRRSRDRFWDGESGASTAAFDTLYTALEVLTRVCAPLLPLTTEEIWRGLTGGRSVHLTDWPDRGDLPGRRRAGGRRWTGPARCAPWPSACARPPACGCGCRCRTSPSSRPTSRAWSRSARSSPTRSTSARSRCSTSRRQRGRASACRRGSRSTPGPPGRGWARTSSGRSRAPSPATGPSTPTAPSPRVASRWSRGSTPWRPWWPRRPTGERRATAVLPGGGFVVLDTTVTPELAQEGLARDIVRAVQQARRDAGLDVSDRISLTVLGDQQVWEATVAHQSLIMEETLATQFGSARRTSNALPAALPTVDAVVGDGQPCASWSRALDGARDPQGHDLDDLDAVLAVGHRTWPATYEGIAGADYVQAGLAKWWSAEATSPAIRQGRLTVAELDGEVCGMASVGPRGGPPGPVAPLRPARAPRPGDRVRAAGRGAGGGRRRATPRSGCPTPRATPRRALLPARGSSRPTTRRAGAGCRPGLDAPRPAAGPDGVADAVRHAPATAPVDPEGVQS